jgi:hypothetical protein
MGGSLFPGTGDITAFSLPGCAAGAAFQGTPQKACAFIWCYTGPLEQAETFDPYAPDLALTW